MIVLVAIITKWPIDGPRSYFKLCKGDLYRPSIINVSVHCPTSRPCRAHLYQYSILRAPISTPFPISAGRMRRDQVLRDYQIIRITSWHMQLRRQQQQRLLGQPGAVGGLRTTLRNRWGVQSRHVTCRTETGLSGLTYVRLIYLYCRGKRVHSWASDLTALNRPITMFYVKYPARCTMAPFMHDRHSTWVLVLVFDGMDQLLRQTCRMTCTTNGCVEWRRRCQ